MKKFWTAAFALTAAVSVAAFGCAEMTLDELKDSFTLEVQTEGLTADELMEKGRQYENGEGVVQWYAMAKALLSAGADRGKHRSRGSTGGVGSP